LIKGTIKTEEIRKEKIVSPSAKGKKLDELIALILAQDAQGQ